MKKDEAIKRMTSDLAGFLAPSALPSNSTPPATVYVTFNASTCTVTDKCDDHGDTIYEHRIDSYGLNGEDFREAARIAFRAVQNLSQFQDKFLFSEI